jgi:hypothetical protein
MLIDLDELGEFPKTTRDVYGRNSRRNVGGGQLALTVVKRGQSGRFGLYLRTGNGWRLDEVFDSFDAAQSAASRARRTRRRLSQSTQRE